ncbi:MAG: hypothetical protein GTN78_11770, partial [Gemmatimonadales bacterium]|nr:hypothetical protein [Gemmatimonadales bacterium]
NAQGVGETSEKLFHDFPGPAWYRRGVAIPRSWQGKVIRLKFGGVHRYADVWVNGEHIGEHIGYLTPFEFDISHAVRPGEDAVIAVRVDARQRRDIDPLIGCFDVIDAMNITWGGMYRGVELEATDGMWIEDVFVVPRIAPRTAEVRVEVGGVSVADGTARAVKLDVQVLDAKGRGAGSGQAILAPDALNAAIPVEIRDMKLWSPKRPHLYTVQVRL